MKLIKLIMPSQGDMEIVKQDGGTILLKPTYFGGECAGPIVQFVDVDDVSGKIEKVAGVDVVFAQPKVEASYRIKIKKDNELKLKRAE